MWTVENRKRYERSHLRYPSDLNFRKAAAPWTYRRVRQRMDCLALENRVLPVTSDPRGTSRTCPAWGEDDRRNRKGEVFRCIGCDHKGDADFVGARNILTECPRAKNVHASVRCFRTVRQSPVRRSSPTIRDAAVPRCLSPVAVAACVVAKSGTLRRTVEAAGSGEFRRTKAISTVSKR